MKLGYIPAALFSFTFMVGAAHAQPWLGPTGTEQRIDYTAGNVYVGTPGFANPLIRSDVVDMANSGRTISFHAFAGTPANGARTTAIWGETNNPNGRGLQGFNFATGPWTTGPSAGLWGESASSNGQGVRARATSATGQNYAGYFDTASNAGVAVYGTATNASGTTYGVWGNVASSSGFAGYFTGGQNYFEGNVGIGTTSPSAKLHVIGTLTVSGAKNFLIDHPSDPENMLLRHSCMESNEYKNMYDGTVVTDEKGYAVVSLPSWFEDLNENFRYQMSVVDEGGSGFAMAKVVKKISDNQFTIRTNFPNIEVSWQVTGTRKDTWARANPLIVEEMKSPEDKGHYLNSAEFGRPDLQIGAPGADVPAAQTSKGATNRTNSTNRGRNPAVPKEAPLSPAINGK